MTTAAPTLDSPLTRVRLVGAKVAKQIERAFGHRTLRDLLYHFPRRYFERGELTDIASLRVGEEATIVARVKKTTVVPFRERQGARLVVTVEDDSGKTLELTFFGKDSRSVEKRKWLLAPGRVALFGGTVSIFNKTLQLTHPDTVPIENSWGLSAEEFAQAPYPVYPATKEVRSWQIARTVGLALTALGPVPDYLPPAIRRARNLVDLDTALRGIHQPRSWDVVRAAQQRLTWDEAFALQVSLVQRKLRAAATPAAARPPRAGGLLDAFDAALPFRLTNGQAAIGAEVAAELAQPHPMHRLLQGEVGSGKTLCALRAMLQVVDAGGQAVLLAPTEVLAGQHYRSIRALLGPLGRAGELDSADEATQVVLVTGAQGAGARRQALAAVASGAAGVVVGTHALLYEGVEFADLGLVVVDEQHRFGVQQRDALRAKAHIPPHVLVMTATPIPRTVAMTVFGDLEVSTLTELPAGRSPIATHVVPVAERPQYLDRAWQRLREEVEAGHQGYVVCPRIGGESAPEDAAGDPSAEDERGGAAARRPATAVLDVAPLLMDGQLAGLRVGVLHGRLPSDEKDAVMRDFAAGKLDVLVATTVIEVGVDVPNATTMIILDADRFGVSQLHQLRGRVGRGSAPGLCLLVTEDLAGAPARERLDAVASTLDGFRLAELDLTQRREGDVLGEAQSGRSSHLRLLSLLRDQDLIAQARQEAIDVLGPDPDLRGAPELAAAVAALVNDEQAEFLEKG